MALKHFCRKQGCSTLTDSGYCELHKAESYQYDQYRGTASERGYDAKWRKSRVLFLKLHPLCKYCLNEGRITAATVVDHIIPHKGNRVLFWDRNNWQPLCKQHHDRKTVNEDGGFGNA